MLQSPSAVGVSPFPHFLRKVSLRVPSLQRYFPFRLPICTFRCGPHLATVPDVPLPPPKIVCQCYCGSAADDYGAQDELVNDECNMLCTATPGEMCGGMNAIEVRARASSEFLDGVNLVATM